MFNPIQLFNGDDEEIPKLKRENARSDFNFINNEENLYYSPFFWDGGWCISSVDTYSNER